MTESDNRIPDAIDPFAAKVLQNYLGVVDHLTRFNDRYRPKSATSGEDGWTKRKVFSSAREQYDKNPENTDLKAYFDTYDKALQMVNEARNAIIEHHTATLGIDLAAEPEEPPEDEKAAAKAARLQGVELAKAAKVMATTIEDNPELQNLFLKVLSDHPLPGVLNRATVDYTGEKPVSPRYRVQVSAHREGVSLLSEKQGKGFTYLDADGKRITDAAERERIEALKTGAARIALRAEADSEWRLGLRIVPIGLTFTRKAFFRGLFAGLAPAVAPGFVVRIREGFPACLQDQFALFDAGVGTCTRRSDTVGQVRRANVLCTMTCVLRTCVLPVHPLERPHARSHRHQPGHDAQHYCEREARRHQDLTNRGQLDAANPAEEPQRGRPTEQHDRHDDVQHGENHERHAAVRPGHLRDVFGAEPRVPRAEAGREPHQREAHEKDRQRGHDLQKRVDPQQLVARDDQHLGERQYGNECGPELRPEEVAQRNRRFPDDPECLTFGGHGGEYEASGNGSLHGDAPATTEVWSVAPVLSGCSPDESVLSASVA